FEKDALRFESIEGNPNDFVSHDHRGNAPKVRSIDSDVVPIDDTESAILRRSSDVSHAADGSLERHHGSVSCPNGHAGIRSAHATELRRGAHAHRVAGRQGRIGGVESAGTPKHSTEKTGQRRQDLSSFVHTPSVTFRASMP